MHVAAEKCNGQFENLLEIISDKETAELDDQLDDGVIAKQEYEQMKDQQKNRDTMV